MNHSDHLTEETFDAGSTGASGPSDVQSDTEQSFGAIDIVEAFTALRHELKLQVRSGRELQELLADGLLKLDKLPGLLKAQSSGGSEADSNAARKLVLALTEMEEALQRVAANSSSPSLSPAEDSLTERIELEISQSSWLGQRFAKRLLNRIRAVVVEHSTTVQQRLELADASQQGLQLLLARVQRLMRECQISRIDVLGKPFDAETMNALDLLETESVPAGCVAEQLRPAYKWRGELVRFAEVRVAK